MHASSTPADSQRTNTTFSTVKLVAPRTFKFRDLLCCLLVSLRQQIVLNLVSIIWYLSWG